MFDRTLQFGSVGLIGAALSVGPAIAADDVTTRPVTQSEPYLRAVEKPNRSIELQVATRHFEPREGRGPRVSLVGVAHIGDRGFYDTLQKRLDAFSLVLYESVKPPGTGGVAGDSDEERRAATEAGMTFIASVLERGHNATGNYPADLAAFRKEVEARADGRL